MEILIEAGRERAAKSNNGSTFFDINPGTMRQHVLAKSLGLVLSFPLSTFASMFNPIYFQRRVGWSRSLILMQCRPVSLSLSWESLQFGPVIFPHPPFNAPFTILFFARDVPFAQRIIHCNRDWSPKRRLSKTF